MLSENHPISDLSLYLSSQMEGVNQSNFPAAHLKLVTESLPNIVRQCSDEQLAQLADVVVKALAQKQDSSDR